MVSTRRRLVLLCGAIPLLAVTILTVTRPAALARLDNALYDFMVRSAPVRPPGGQVVIVDIDEESLATIGQWPWRRDVIGRLVDRLRASGAAVVALDIIFPEPDRFSSPGGVDPDGALAGALSRGRVVLGYAMTFDGPSRGTCVLHP